MSNTLHYDDPNSDRLDRWLCTQFPDRSRSEIHRWMGAGFVHVNGQPCRKSQKLRTGDVVTFSPAIEEPGNFTLTPQDLPLDVLHEDEAVIVVNKAPGMVVHPGAGADAATLANAAVHRWPEIADVGDAHRPGIAHRLDANTSGVMVLARTTASLENLQRQFKQRETAKEYRCLVLGSFSEPAVTQTLNGPIGRSPRDRKKMAVLKEGGRDAVSHVTTLTVFGDRLASECAVKIETGRTHQIRVHLSNARHPILGDHLYGGRQREIKLVGVAAARQMLHAFRLRFQHPEYNTAMQFEAPLPADYLTVREQLRAAGEHHVS